MGIEGILEKSVVTTSLDTMHQLHAHRITVADDFWLGMLRGGNDASRRGSL